jgi:hypothetical protein
MLSKALICRSILLILRDRSVGFSLLEPCPAGLADAPWLCGARKAPSSCPQYRKDWPNVIFLTFGRDRIGLFRAGINP